MLQQLIAAVIRRRYALLAVAAVLGVVAAFAGRQLTLDRSIENMFAPDDPVLVPYRRLQRTFGQNEIVMAVYPDDQLTSPAGKARLEKLTAKLRGTPGVAAVVSLLDPPAAIDFNNRGIGARFRNVFVGYTHNAALDAAGVVCLIKRPDASNVPRRETLADLEAAVAEYPGGVLVGEPVMIEQAFDLLDRDGARLNTWCTALVLLTLFACFRSLRWVLLPLAVVQLTLALTRATLVLAHLKLSMVSSMLAAIITVVGVAAIVHVIVRFQTFRQRGLGPQEALRETLKQLAAPVAFACLTDAVGFAALMISNVGPVHDFGLMMSIGSLLVLPSCLLVTPGLSLLGMRATAGPDTRATAGLPSSGVRENANPSESADRSTSQATGLETGFETRLETRLDKCLQGALNSSQRHKRLLAVLGIVVTGFAILGSTRLERETQFTKNFRDDSQIVKAYDFVERQFGGAGVWDIQIPVPKRLDKAFLLKVLEFEKALKAEAPQLGTAISVADAVDAGVGAGGLKKRRVFDSMIVSAGLTTLRSQMPEFINAMQNVDPTDDRVWLRILLRAPEQLDAADKTALIEKVKRLATEHFPQAETTGYYVLLTKLIASVLADQWITFGVAALAVLLVMTFAFRNLPLALATMVPNVLPVLVLFGAMGWLGIRINMGAAMIAAVSVGLSVDGSIHYIMAYQRLRKAGQPLDAALAEVQSLVGRAASYATLALVVGFATLATSDFLPTAYFGVLVSLSMIGGLAGNLIALPLFIRALDRTNGVTA